MSLVATSADSVPSLRERSGLALGLPIGYMYMYIRIRSPHLLIFFFTISYHDTNYLFKKTKTNENVILNLGIIFFFHELSPIDFFYRIFISKLLKI